MLVEGVGQAEVCSLLKLLMDLGEPRADINAMMNDDWHFCRAFNKGRSTMRTAFSEKGHAQFRRKLSFSPDASELLILFPVLGYYLETVAKPKYGDVLSAAANSYHACACCIALAKEGKFDASLAARLDNAILQHAELKHIAYPAENYRAKDHWRFHLPDQMARDGYILDCFAGERVNRAFKRCAQEVTFDIKHKTTLVFEASVLKRTMVHFEAQWEEHDWADRLLSSTPSPELGRAYGSASCYVSNTMMIAGAVVAKNDIVLIDGSPHVVIGCASIDGHLAAVCHRLIWAHQVSLTAHIYRLAAESWELKWISDHVLRYAVAWLVKGDDFIILSV